jgi:predicted SprT family Zn-dependent metalloprotease
MYENNYIGIVTEELYKAFDILNKKYFDAKLEYPIITIQKRKKITKGYVNNGWFTTNRTWSDKSGENKKYEINISAEHLKDDIHSIMATLLHEMVHYLNKNLEIKDCNGQIHNKRFKEAAESVGLITMRDQKLGWITSASDEFSEFVDSIIKSNENAFSYFRMVFTEKDKESKPREKKTFSYTCPICGEKIKARRDRNIICGECDCEFEMEDEV